MTAIPLGSGAAPTLFTFGLPPGSEATIEVVSGDPVDYSFDIRGPFPDTADGTIKVGETRAFDRVALLRGTGNTEVELTQPTPAEIETPADEPPPGPS